MYYHASQTPDIRVLEPRFSNHKVPLVYFSKKRENVLVYLSNAIEKYCKETGFVYDGIWQKWGPYGFSKDGRLQLDEYYPNALESTYRGVSAYIYAAESIEEYDLALGIPDAAVSAIPVPVSQVEYVPDALEAILKAEREGKIIIRRYAETKEILTPWLQRIIPKEYAESVDHPEYRHFLRGCFPGMIEP